MGVPVSGKNLFPSNIQGLPTWFSIRANEKAWTARHVRYDLLVCMNETTYVEDVKKLEPGSFVIHHPHMQVSAIRKDVTSIPVPFSELVAQACVEVRLRKLAVNMIYVGVLAEILGVDNEAVMAALKQQFSTKQKVIQLNLDCIEAGRDWAKKESWPEKIPLRVERRQLTDSKILIEGNAAAALGAMFGGCQLVSWYPITPSSSLVDAFVEYADRYRVDPKTGKKNFVVIQAEDELSAIGMTLGASWMGARAMTATSGPGISLMAEFTGYAYYAELPTVIFDIQRVGPSTGLPTRTSQSDIEFVASLSHGDTKIPMLFPGSVKECFEFGGKAFDFAEQLQSPLFVMSDLDLGMNFWMSDPFEYPSEKWNRGKILSDQDEEKLKDFGRYKDVDGDGISYRTLPGMKDRRGVFFTRGSGHNEMAAYTESSEAYVRNMNRLLQKWETAKEILPRPILERNADSPWGVIAFGSTHDAVRESLAELESQGLSLSYLRICSYPFHQDVEDFLERHQSVFVIEQNRDAQMRNLLAKELRRYAHKLESILHFDGLPIPASFVSDRILDNLDPKGVKKNVAS
jgi:2-oxoglutarate ferredoxin oxidoreductase subunit alpha